MAKDPVCGMEVDEKGANAKSLVDGKKYFFCCPHCKARFDKEPSKFITGQ